MCLNLKKDSCVQIAEKDIVVYKHLKENKNGLRTTYQNSLIEIGNTYESELEKNEDNNVEIGLHSFASKEKCIVDGRDEYADVIVKCIIPKGSNYYVGKFFGDTSYASDKLTYVEVIKNL